MTETGKLIVISGPSGSGKSTVIAQAMAMRENLTFSVSATTRSPRAGEKHGVDYFFMTPEEFEALLAEDALLEHACYVGNYYGTPRAAVEERLAAGQDVILDIEVQGAAQIRASMPEAILVFLLPPSFAELERRLLDRGKDSLEKIQGRLARAREEYRQADMYDYIIINDNVDRAGRELDAIITAEKCRMAERICLVRTMLDLDAGIQ